MRGVKAKIDGTPGKRRVNIKPEDVKAVRCQLVRISVNSATQFGIFGHP